MHYVMVTSSFILFENFCLYPHSHENVIHEKCYLGTVFGFAFHMEVCNLLVPVLYFWCKVSARFPFFSFQIHNYFPIDLQCYLCQISTIPGSIALIMKDVISLTLTKKKKIYELLLLHGRNKETDSQSQHLSSTKQLINNRLIIQNQVPLNPKAKLLTP